MSTLNKLTIVGKPRAFPYLRWSSDPQTWGDSERRQNKKANDYCAREGLEIQEPFVDRGVSAKAGANRKRGAFKRLLEQAKAGDYILIETQDRFSREDAITALNALKDIVLRGITMVFIDSGMKITKDNYLKPEVLFPCFMKCLTANDENQRKMERVQSGWKTLKERAAKEKKIMTSSTPAWLEADKEANKWNYVKPHIDTIKRIFCEYTAGKGIRTIMRALNREKVPTFGRGKQNHGMWSNTHLRRLLGGRNVLGEYQPHKYVEDDRGIKSRIPEGPAIENYYPQVIEPAVFHEAQRILARNGHPSGCRNKVTNLFTGIVKCAKCGNSMTIKQDTTRGKYHYTYLKCSHGVHNSTGCGYTVINYDWVERAVLTVLWSKVVPLMKEGDNGQDELAAKQGELLHVEKLLVNYEKKLLDPELASEALLRAVKANETKQKTLKREIEALAARSESNPLASWTHVPKTTGNRLKLQTILADEIVSLKLDATKLTGELNIKDWEFELSWERGKKDGFKLGGKFFGYVDDYLVWKTDKSVKFDMRKFVPNEPLKNAA